jgi:metal-responsive CopG/Arc/MetJ family transcriptional regulator
MWIELWSILHNVETIQVVLNEDLLRAADRAAKKNHVNRSALVREALQEHLKRLRIQEMETRDRKGYTEHPVSSTLAWEGVASWPEE